MEIQEAFFLTTDGVYDLVLVTLFASAASTD